MEDKPFESDQSETVERSRLDTLSLSDEHQKVLRTITRQKTATLTVISTQLNQGEEAILPVLNELVQGGFVQEISVDGERRYQANFAPKRARTLPDQIWHKLEEP